ncbi:hypothetical protein QYE76_052181 [Lolium multiflorum]|uniref:CCHC-type domain-containing protein n=1 Tax=Lolium multiflorum TaxID=4521 RepID=A0AAD8SUN9_LOLMU|nr:hypothetical protein QYE76_052181 [Lolium multiflorum]
MDSTASHPPGFSRRWEVEGGASSSAASPPRGEHVSGLGISSESSEGSVAAPRAGRVEAAPPVDRGRAKDRLGWEQPPPSKKSLWRRRVEARNAPGQPGWGASVPEMEGLCFRCFEPGHRKRDCTNAEVCLRCGKKGHPALGCTRPRSPSSEEELRSRALAKMARRRSPVRERVERPTEKGGVAPVPPGPPPQRPPSPPLPPPPPLPPVASRLPPMEALPPLSVEPFRTEALVRLEEEVLEEPALCVVRRTAAMGDLEQRLQFAMVASVGGRRPAVSCAQVVAALRWRGVPENAMSVHSFAPEDFLVIFASEELRNHVTSRSPVLVAGAPLSWRPWNRQAQAELVPLRQKVWLILEGIPPHAWDVAVVEDVLGRSCAVEEVAPETKNRTDLAFFKLTAWTSQIEDIPVVRKLAIPEPILGARSTAGLMLDGAPTASPQIKTLQYKILVHVVRVEEEVPPGSRSDSGRREAGDGGFPGDGPRGPGGEGPSWRSRDVPWRRGVPDRRRGPGGFAARVHGSGSSQREVGDDDVAAPAPLAWGLPCMASPAPLVAGGVAFSQKRPAESGRPGLGAAGQDEPISHLQPEERISCRPFGKSTGGVEEVVQPFCLTKEMGDRQDTEEGAVVVDKGAQEFGTEVAPGLDKVVWQDAVETLPGTEMDPEERAKAMLVDPIGPARVLSPGFSSVGSSVRAGADQCTDKGETGSVESQDVARKGQGEEDYFAVSVEIPQRNHAMAQAQEALVDRVLNFTELEESQSTSFTGPNSAMQLVPREKICRREEEVDVGNQEQRQREALDLERQEMERIKRFCASILKTLAPPLLHEVERASKLRAEAEPFTPKRVTRRTVATCASTQGKKASAAENALLKALGICPENLSATEEDLVRFRGFFDSPIRDSHVRVLASIFGKELPPSFTSQEYCRVAVAAH